MSTKDTENQESVEIGGLGIGSILHITASDELNEYEWAEGSIKVPIAELLNTGTVNITE